MRHLTISAFTLLLTGLVACDNSTSPGKNARSPALGSLPVGGVRSLTFAEAPDGLTIPENLTSADYLVVVSNVDVQSNTDNEYVVRGNRGIEFESKLRATERRQFALPAARTAKLTPRLRKNAFPGAGRLAVVPPAVGSSMQLNVYKEGPTVGGCPQYTVTTGIVRAVGANVIIVTDQETPAGGFTTPDYNSIVSEFDRITYPTGVAYFGNPSDIDTNGRVIVYYTPRVNEMTPAGTAKTDGYVGGFFYAGDLLSAEGCAVSNEKEIFYMLTPDPSSAPVFGNQFSVDQIRHVTRGTIAHEFQHMINSANRIYVTQAPFESAWLDEALAHFAEDVTGRVVLGIGDLAKISVNRMSQMSEDDQFAFFLQNLQRARIFLERPDTSSPIGNEGRGTTLAGRGASWSLLRYTADWYSDNSPRVLTKKLAMGPDTGIVNLTKAAGVPLDTLLSRWLVTLYTDNLNIANLNARYNYKSYDFRPLITALDQPNYALKVTPVGNGTATVATTVRGGSAAYFLTTLRGNGVRTIKVTDVTGAPVTDVNGRLYIVRLR